MLHDGLVGIVAGVITTWILFIGKVFFQAKISPYLREIRYQGVKVDGAWIGKNETSDVRLYLFQSAHSLSGSMMLKIEDESYVRNLDFNVQGYMWEGYITLNLLPKDRRVTSYATALVKLSNGGAGLDGTFCFRNVQLDKVETTSLSLSRDVIQIATKCSESS